MSPTLLDSGSIACMLLLIPSSNVGSPLCLSLHPVAWIPLLYFPYSIIDGPGTELALWSTLWHHWGFILQLLPCPEQIPHCRLGVTHDWLPEIWNLPLLNLHSTALVSQYWVSALNLVYPKCFVLIIDQVCCHYWSGTLKHESYLHGAIACRCSLPPLFSWQSRSCVMLLFRHHPRSSKLQNVPGFYSWCATPMVLIPPITCIAYGTCVPMYIVTVLEFVFFSTCPATTELTL